MKAASRSFATALREPGASLRCLIANQWNGLALAVDTRARVCWVSGKCERWLGLESGRGLGEILWRELELPWTLECPAFREAFAGREAELQVSARRAPDGELRAYGARLVPLREARRVAAVLVLIEELGESAHREALEREIIQIANREQNRIGGDLHDGLGQDLTGIALMLRGIDAQLRQEGSSIRLDEVIGLVNGAIENTRALARGLSPVSAERDGLRAALQALATRVASRHGLPVKFEARTTQPVRLDETAATHLYRIAQEALTNALRHSLATRVRIRLESARGALHLKVQDNGRGIGAEALGGASDGLGLKIMRYRAQMLGGNLVIERGPDGGALVRCSCPLG
jgi:two-component system, NarL family, sensor histidine kinase UhpB